LIPAQSAKKRDQLSAISHQLAISIQLLNQSAQHTLDLHHSLGGLSVIVSVIINLIVLAALLTISGRWTFNPARTPGGWNFR